ncbi:MAG: hypothetical protein U9P38_04495 [Campylobacterota bacterium]|nr:hypothetical protein [Campylobacterota bacterium]
MQKIIYSLFFITSLLSSKPTDFSIVIEKPFNDALFDITQDYDRQISAIGFSQSFQTTDSRTSNSYSNVFEYLNSASNSYGSQIHLIKMDQYAKITHSKIKKLKNFNKPAAIVKTPTNGYFVGGYTLDGSLIVLKLNANGDTIFTRMFGTKNYDKMNKMILLADGGLLTIGSAITTRSKSDNLFETGLGKNDIYLTRFSKDGLMLWSKKYGTKNDDIGIDAVEAVDGSIVVISTTSYNNQKELSFMRITEDGDKIWLEKYKSEKKVTPYKLIRLRDNNFLLTLSYQDDMDKEQIRLVKFDLYKNILIDKNISTTYSSVLKDIKEFTDRSLIAVGHVKDEFNSDGLVMVLGSDLNMLTQEHYGNDNYDKFNAVTILHNSEVAVAGINRSKNSQESNMWILKLDREGKILNY